MAKIEIKEKKLHLMKLRCNIAEKELKLDQLEENRERIKSDMEKTLEQITNVELEIESLESQE
jgi:hypothetical protein